MRITNWTIMCTDRSDWKNLESKQRYRDWSAWVNKVRNPIVIAIFSTIWWFFIFIFFMEPNKYIIYCKLWFIYWLLFVKIFKPINNGFYNSRFWFWCVNKLFFFMIGLLFSILLMIPSCFLQGFSFVFLVLSMRFFILLKFRLYGIRRGIHSFLIWATILIFW